MAKTLAEMKADVIEYLESVTKIKVAADPAGKCDVEDYTLRSIAHGFNVLEELAKGAGHEECVLDALGQSFDMINDAGNLQTHNVGLLNGTHQQAQPRTIGELLQQLKNQRETIGHEMPLNDEPLTTEAAGEDITDAEIVSEETPTSIGDALLLAITDPLIRH